MTGAPITVVVTDASVVINLIITERLPLLARLAGYRFMIPDEVIEEVRRPEQRQALDAAIAGEALCPCSVDAIEAADLILTLGDVLGRGELACLALASQYGWTVLCCERGRFRREARIRFGSERVVTGIPWATHDQEGNDADS